MSTEKNGFEAPGLKASDAESEGDREVGELVKPSKDQTSSLENEAEMYDGFWQRRAKMMARVPRIYLGAASFVSIVLSVIGFTVGGFDASVDNAGWQSRGTLIANRQTQLMLVDSFQKKLFDNDKTWDDLLNNVQKGWQTTSLGNAGERDGDDDERRLLKIDGEFSLSSSSKKENSFFSPHFRRLNIDQADLPGCDVDWYYNQTKLEEQEHLWPIWKSSSPSNTLLSPELMRDICIAERNTQRVLESRGLCFGCDEGCLPPFSPVLYARVEIDGGFQMDCEELSKAWESYQSETETKWAKCVADLKAVYDPLNDFEIPESCPATFSAALVEANFDETKWMTYTSSIFATSKRDVNALYEIVDEFDQGSGLVTGAYDTQYEGFNSKFTDSVVGRDMMLACGSAFITAIAILVHTRSPFITGIGLLQIILSFPLSFFVYTFLGGLDFFPFLNFIGVFVVFALGADNIFVSVDKWKNARLEHRKSDSAVIAAIALPDAAGAMFLTTITTAIAFFATAICPVAPIKMFAVFCGLLIMFDYLMCILLVFPALCIYDKKVMAGASGCCTACHCCERKSHDDNGDSEETTSLIHRILYAFYELLHKFRWFLLALSLGGFAAATWGATTLQLPTSSEVRLFAEDAVQYEQNFIWRDKLLINALEKSGGSEVLFGWGISPADTGDLNNPQTWSQLVLDETFDLSPEENQNYMVKFCPELFAADFASLPDGFECAFNRFAQYLKNESEAAIPNDGYLANCGNATGIPVPESSLDACLIDWTRQTNETSILSYDGKVRILFLPFVSRVRFDSPFDDLESEWGLIENWVNEKSALAPEGVNQFFFSSMDFWWYDTNSQMLSTAYGAASIALGAAALVIFLSSRSLVLTLFATFTIGYVLTSVTSTLVAIGWTLGFLESICFAILIGVSVDFVIHFCHAYAHASGDRDRHERSKDALIRMGPSILAAGFTTVAAAIIMLFTIISFFQKFALILFMTIVQATIGAFIIFLTLTDCLGPSHPTYLVDTCIFKLTGKKMGNSNDSGNKESRNVEETMVTTDSSGFEKRHSEK